MIAPLRALPTVEDNNQPADDTERDALAFTRRLANDGPIWYMDGPDVEPDFYAQEAIRLGYARAIRQSFVEHDRLTIVATDRGRAAVGLKPLPWWQRLLQP